MMKDIHWYLIGQFCEAPQIVGDVILRELSAQSPRRCYQEDNLNFGREGIRDSNEPTDLRGSWQPCPPSQALFRSEAPVTDLDVESSYTSTPLLDRSMANSCDDVKQRVDSMPFQLLPSVGTWLFVQHRAKIYASVGEEGCHGNDLHREVHTSTSDPSWSEEETGVQISRLMEDYHMLSRCSQGEAFSKLQEGIEFVATRCPSSNIPWLYKLLDTVKEHSDQQLIESQKQECKERVHDTMQHESSSAFHRQQEVQDSAHAMADQIWHDQSRGRWWFRGEIICYYCGEASCEDALGRCCEIRKREILGIPDQGHRRKQRKARK